MKKLGHFSIPLEGLKDGKREFIFRLDNEFFDSFENSPVKTGIFEARLELEKKSNLIELDFDIAGTMGTPCDRCLADIDLPLQMEDHLIIKYADEEKAEEEVIYIKRDTDHFNVAKFLYECICLNLPLIMVYECRETEPYPCNEKVLDKIEGEVEEEKKGNVTNPIWDQLKNDFNNNY